MAEKKHPRERAVFDLSRGEIRSLSWSPDGTRLAFAAERGGGVIDRDGTRVWDLEDGWDVVSWSPDGARLTFCSSSPGNQLVIDAATGQQIRAYEGSPAVLWWGSRMWNPTGRELIAPFARPGNISVTAAEDGSLLGEIGWSISDLRSCSWSPDGERIALRNTNGPVTLLDAATHAKVWESEKGYFLSTCWSPDGRRIASVNYNISELFVWDVSTGRRVGSIDTRHKGARAADWSPTGDIFATGGSDATVALWAADGLTELDRLGGHTEYVWATAFAPGGGVLASASHDGTVRLWDVSDLVPERARVVADPAAAFLAAQCRSVGRIPVGTAAPAERWVPTALPGAGSAPHLLGRLKDAGERIDLFPDGRHLLSGNVDTGRLCKWQLDTGTDLWDVQPNTTPHYEVRVSPTTDRVATVDGGSGVLVHDSVTGLACSTWEEPHPTYGFSWSADGQQLAVGTRNGIQLRDAATGAAAAPFASTPSDVMSLDQTRDGARLTSAENNGTIRVWDITPDGLRLRWHTQPSEERLYGVRWSPDGTRLATAASSGEVRIWDAVAGTVLVEGRINSIAYRVAWSPDGRLVASTSNDKTVRVWDAATGAEVDRFGEATGRTLSVAWAASGAFLVAGATGGAYVWDTRYLVPALPAPAVATGSPTPTPAELGVLPAALAACHRVGVRPPLALVRDALALAAGHAPAPDSPLTPVAAHAAWARLAALRWPTPALAGVAAYALRGLPHPDAFTPPAALPPIDLTSALAAALANCTDGPPDAPPPTPTGPVAAALDALTPAAVAVLRAAGPAAATRDPGLAARAAAAPAPRGPVRPGRGGGRSGGPNAPGAGGGADRAGLATRGDWRSVLPSQWALPVAALAAKERRGEVLFRAARAAAPGGRVPVVVVVDASAACAGPVGAAVRAAGWAVLSAWAAAGAKAWAVVAGKAGVQAWEVRSAADAAAVHAAVGGGLSQGPEVMTAADRVRRAAGPGAAVLVASHNWFGAGVARAGRTAAVLVKPPGGRGAGPRGWADRWTEVPADPAAAASAALDLLLTPW